MESPSIHIVVLNWNGLEDTFECLSSLRKLQYDRMRVHVVDNASHNREADKIGEAFPEVDLVRQDQNVGFSGGCNVGMRRAISEGADYVVLLNNDTVVPPELLQSLLSAYTGLESPGAISPLILKKDTTDEVWFSVARWRSTWKTGETGFQLRSELPFETVRKAEPYRSDFACGCCLFTSAKVINEVGFFDERYFAFYDEAEWCARMFRKGYNSYVVPNVQIHHKVGGSTPNLVMTYLLTRNRLLWISENLPPKKKLAAYSVMTKEFGWHVLNICRFIPASKRHLSRKQSAAFLYGTKDYVLRRFGKWSPGAESVIFDKQHLSK